MQENNLIIVICSYSISPEILINKFTKIAKKYHLKFRGVIITNNIKYNTNQNIDNWLISSGSNSILDFSAYFEGIELINDKISNNSHILFFNDTLLLKHDFNFSLNEIFKYLDLMNEIEVESIIGYKSNYNSICLVNPWSKLNVFIPTYLFLLNFKAFEIFHNLKETYYSKNMVVNDDIFKKLLISSNFLELLKAHTIYSKSPISWSSSTGNLNSKELMYKKALCVYLEHRLSGEIGKNGALIFLNGSRWLQFNILVRETFIRIKNKYFRCIK